jgi:hypothetical protein
MDTDVGPAYKANSGNVLIGTSGNAPHGELVAKDQVRTYCLPFILTPMSNQRKLLPLFSADALRFKLVLESFSNSLITPAKGTAVLNGYSISDVELIGYITELSPSAMANLDRMTNGMYNILAPTWSNFQTSMAANTTGVTSTIGIACSSLERVFVIHRPTAAAVDAGASLGHRITNNLNYWNLIINGEQFPNRYINVQTSADQGCAESLAELLISDHSLSNFDKVNTLQAAIYCNSSVSVATKSTTVYVNQSEAAFEVGLATASSVAGLKPWQAKTATGLETGLLSGATSTTVGSFVASLELESGVSAGKSDRLYSGVNTMSKVVQYRGVYGTGAIACTLDFFANYTVLLSLNMRGNGIWQMNV